MLSVARQPSFQKYFSEFYLILDSWCSPRGSREIIGCSVVSLAGYRCFVFCKAARCPDVCAVRAVASFVVVCAVAAV